MKRVPTLALTTFGLKISVIGSQTITPSTPDPSEALKMLPKFPGFSILSQTTKKGFFLFFIISLSSSNFLFF